MEIKLKFSEVLRINAVLKAIIEDSQIKIDALLKFRLLGIMRSIESHISDFEIIKNEKIVAYGEEAEDGVYQIKPDNVKALEQFEKDIRQIIDSEVLIHVQMLKPDEVFDKGLSTECLMGLYSIISK